MYNTNHYYTTIVHTKRRNQDATRSLVRLDRGIRIEVTLSSLIYNTDTSIRNNADTNRALILVFAYVDPGSRITNGSRIDIFLHCISNDSQKNWPIRPNDTITTNIISETKELTQHTQLKAKGSSYSYSRHIHN